MFQACLSPFLDLVFGDTCCPSRVNRFSRRLLRADKRREGFKELA
jgi:hypothetical protein